MKVVGSSSLNSYLKHHKIIIWFVLKMPSSSYHARMHLRLIHKLICTYWSCNLKPGCESLHLLKWPSSHSLRRGPAPRTWSGSCTPSSSPGLPRPSVSWCPLCRISSVDTLRVRSPGSSPLTGMRTTTTSLSLASTAPEDTTATPMTRQQVRAILIFLFCYLNFFFTLTFALF